MIEGQEGVTWEQWVALARACEEHGLDGLFRSDHYLSITRGAKRPDGAAESAKRPDARAQPARPPDGAAESAPRVGSLDAWATISALAAVTKRIRLGTLVSPVTFRPASVLAKNVVTADHVSGGRVELGIGAGWYEAEHEVYGFPFLTAKDRVALLRQQIETIVHQWTDHPDVWPKPVRQPHPPLIVGGGGKPGTVGPAVRWATEYNTTNAGLDDCRERRRALDVACRKAGRAPETLPLSLMATCLVGVDDADLRERVALYLRETGSDQSVVGYLRDDSPDRLVGTLEQVAERLAAYEEAGVSRAMLRPPAHEDVEMIPLLGQLAGPTANA
jgi:alkanesulfonate monooxygenase SsuD/methylene tetrahydromethanopterin reductase-like flavin-dependent oxidoreductase (luciferase family)